VISNFGLGGSPPVEFWKLVKRWCIRDIFYYTITIPEGFYTFNTTSNTSIASIPTPSTVASTNQCIGGQGYGSFINAFNNAATAVGCPAQLLVQTSYGLTTPAPGAGTAGFFAQAVVDFGAGNTGMFTPTNVTTGDTNYYSTRGFLIMALPMDGTLTRFKTFGPWGGYYTRWFDVLSYELLKHQKNPSSTSAYGTKNIVARIWLDDIDHTSSQNPLRRNPTYIPKWVNYDAGEILTSVNFQLIDEWNQPLYQPSFVSGVNPNAAQSAFY